MKAKETSGASSPIDLRIDNARIVDVFTGNIVPGSIAVQNGHIVGLGHYPARQCIDLQGRFVAPGLIDAHVHIESSLAHPGQFARAVLSRGTTAVVADPHEIANVMGTGGIDYMLRAAGQTPLCSLFFSLPSCVPATHMETSGATLTADDLRPYFDHDRIVALAEVMNYPGVIAAEPAVMQKIDLARQRRMRVDGHAPGLGGTDLAAYVAAGITSDHECASASEAREKLAAGMHIMVREGSAAKNLEDLLPVINAWTSRRMMWCTDDRHPHDLMDEGHIDALIRAAVAGGIDPVTAIRMATLNPAAYFGLRHIGAIAPGRRADLVVLSDLHAFDIEQVYSGGVLVAEHHRILSDRFRFDPEPIPPVMNLDIAAVDLSIAAASGRGRVIGVVPGQLITRHRIEALRIVEGRCVSDISRDILKIAVVERYTGNGGIGRGFAGGLGLKDGAIASSIAHDAHNIICVGVNDPDMKMAMSEVVHMGGGLAVVAGGRVLGSLALPVAGLMSVAPIREIRNDLDHLLTVARELGATPPDPFMALSFLALPVIPELKITDKGLVDVKRFCVVPLFSD